MKYLNRYTTEFRFWMLMVSVSLIFILGFVYFLMSTVYPLHNEMVRNRAIETLTHMKIAATKMDSVEMQSYLEQVVEKSQDLSYLLIMDTTGKTIAHSNPKRIGMNFYDEAFIKCLNQKAMVERIYYRDADNPASPFHNEKTIDILDIYLDASGKIAGEVNIGISYAKIEEAKNRYYLFALVGTLLWLFFMGGFAFYNIQMSNRQKRLHFEIRQEQDKYKTLMENTLDIPFTVDARGNFQIIGPQISNYGVDPKSILGKNVVSIIHPDDIPHVMESFRKAYETKKTDGNIFRYIAKEKSIIWFEEKANPIFDSSGEVVAFTGILRDITEKKKAEIALIESEERFKLLFDSAPYSLSVTNQAGRILTVNKAFCKFVQLPLEEITGKHFSEIGFAIDIKEKLPLYLQELLETGFVKSNEIEVNNREGKKIYLIFSSILINFQNEKFILSSVVDISEAKLIAEELEKHKTRLEELVNERTEQLAHANEELEQINKELTTTNHELEVLNEELSKQREELEISIDNLHNTQQQLIKSEKMSLLGTLASGLAHEINNPLNFINGGIIGLERYFEDNISEHKKRVKPLFEAMNTGVKRAAGIIASLNNYSRRSEKKNTKCDLHSVINDCLVILNSKLRYRIAISLNFTDIHYSLSANEGKLHQAILNVLLNSVEAIAEKGEIAISTNIVGNKMILTIADSGTGISEDILPHVFDPFFTTKEPGKGTGLGLSVVDSIIREHDGTIEINSRLGYGTEVKIIFPLNKC